MNPSSFVLLLAMAATTVLAKAQSNEAVFFNLFNNSAIELHGTMTGSAGRLRDF